MYQNWAFDVKFAILIFNSVEQKLSQNHGSRRGQHVGSFGSTEHPTRVWNSIENQEIFYFGVRAVEVVDFVCLCCLVLIFLTGMKFQSTLKVQRMKTAIRLCWTPLHPRQHQSVMPF